MNPYLIVMPDYSLWMVQAEDVDHALSLYRRDMPRARGRHRGVFAQVVAPHRMNENTDGGTDDRSNPEPG